MYFKVKNIALHGEHSNQISINFIVNIFHWYGIFLVVSASNTLSVFIDIVLAFTIEIVTW